MTRRGRVQRDTSLGDGVVAVEGKQYAFPLESVWQTELPPRAGMLVDVTFASSGAPAKIVAVAEAQIAREQAEQALAGVRRQGSALTETIQNRYPLSVFAAELGLLISFFALPSVSIPLAERSFSAWQVIGMDTRTMMSDDRGLLSLIAIPCLFAPLAVSFIKQFWARWIYLAPLLYFVLAALTLYLQIASAGHAAQRELGDAFGPVGGQLAREMTNQAGGMIHLGFGALAVLLCALYLAGRVRHPLLSHSSSIH